MVDVEVSNYFEDACKRVSNVISALEILEKQHNIKILKGHPKRIFVGKKKLMRFSKIKAIKQPESKSYVSIFDSDSIKIYKSLQKISPNLANSYAQVKADLKDEGRLSWAGTAHELREIISTLLRELAPDEQVKGQKNYRQESQTSGPTQKQRVLYIAAKNKLTSKETELLEQSDDLDELLANIVRSFYGRASDAAHRLKGRDEVKKLLRYFEAFIVDLLDI